MDFPVKYKLLWSDWGIHVMMLLSLFIQIILIFLGHFRKNSTSKWIRMLVWSSYLLANWVADFMLGQLSNAMNDSSSSNAIIAFWAPFLILHLGGPDTITAYSMEDNELWSRHLIGLIYELIIAFYVLVRSLPNTRLLAPIILIYFVAIIKYAERSYSLYKGSTKGFRSSVLSSTEKPQIDKSVRISNMNGLNTLNGAFIFYSFYKPVFVDHYSHMLANIDVPDVDMRDKSIFNLTSIELSFAYDELYTKAAVNHSRVGYVLRAFCSICILLAFSLFILAPKDGFHKLDVAITYVLLAASIFLDSMAIIMLMFSDWMMVTLLNVTKLRKFSMLLAEHIFRIKTMCLKRKYWLGEIPQLNLISNCLEYYALNKDHRRRIMVWIKEKLSSVFETKSYLNNFFMYKAVPLRTLHPIQGTKELHDVIITYLQNWFGEYVDNDGSITLGSFAFEEVTTVFYWVDPSFFRLTDELPLDQQVLLWHISTELCFHWKSEFLHPLYHHQIEIEAEDNKQRCLEMEVCKYLSNYMMYLILMRPDMMSTTGGTSQMNFRLAYESIVELTSIRVDNNHLLMRNAKFEEVFEGLCREMMIGEENINSFLHIALILTFVMLGFKKEERWQVMNKVWVHLLVKGVQNTKATTHMKQLSRGGELCTFIWLITKHAIEADILEMTNSKLEKLIHMTPELSSKIKDYLQSQH